MLRNVAGVLLTLLIAASLSAADFGLTELDVRAGESVNGFPNWNERVLLTWINRARVDPQIEMQACGPKCAEAACYKPMPPLTWTTALNRAARFHADAMTRQNFFGHDSACRIVSNIDALYPAGCDGSASCACAGSGTTAWSERIGLFGAQGMGEIIALGADPNASFYMWLFETSPTPTCEFTGYNGHRWLILRHSGAAGAGYNEERRIAVTDFGPGSAPYRIPSGSHYPRQAASVEMWANWYDGAAPKSAAVVVNGQCTSMSLRRGSGTNGAWSATVSGAGSGCHRYYFSFIDSAGREVTYPVTGSLGIGCEEWNSSRTTASCSGTTTPSEPEPSKQGRRRAAGRG
ncbi:MAG TPA: CAP domain-containing protein [Thermoanaerobaculia bacterium]|nr:CAP domain-containing protein [Thermoanaerobaculia bacterium]